MNKKAKREEKEKEEKYYPQIQNKVWTDDIELSNSVLQQDFPKCSFVKLRL